MTSKLDLFWLNGIVACHFNNHYNIMCNVYIHSTVGSSIANIYGQGTIFTKV